MKQTSYHIIYTREGYCDEGGCVARPGDGIYTEGERERVAGDISNAGEVVGVIFCRVIPGEVLEVLRGKPQRYVEGGFQNMLGDAVRLYWRW